MLYNNICKVVKQMIYTLQKKDLATVDTLPKQNRYKAENKNGTTQEGRRQKPTNLKGGGKNVTRRLRNNKRWLLHNQRHNIWVIKCLLWLYKIIKKAVPFSYYIKRLLKSQYKIENIKQRRLNHENNFLCSIKRKHKNIK